MENLYCVTYSTLDGAPLAKIYNKQGKIEEYVNKILKIIENY